jgi:arylsulfatase A-like enzyme
VETDALTDFSDLLPTFAELGGAEIPSNLVLDGKSMAQVILGKASDSPRNWIMALGHGAARRDAEGVRGVDDYADRVIRDRRYKVWIEPNRNISAFYDLQSDPLERHNLLGSQLSEPARMSLAKFQGVMKTMPANDARPQYRPRESQPWDKAVGSSKRKPSPKSRSPKKRRSQKK